MSQHSAIDPKDLLFDLFRTFVNQAAAKHCLAPHLSTITQANIHVVGAGKAAAAMAKEIERFFARPISGIVVTRYGHAADCEFIEVIEASHPIPDEAGSLATKRIVESVNELNSTDLVVCVISGGASSLLSLPLQPISLEQKRSITRQLLNSGANIHEINCVRKHLSAVKGGRLMQSIFPASAVTLCISDVVGDDPSVIGSGPTVPDPTTRQDVLNIVQKYQIKFPGRIRQLLSSKTFETPKPNDPVFERSKVIVAAKPSTCLEASANLAKKLGIRVINLGDVIEGDAKQVAKEQANLIRRLIGNTRIQNAHVVLSGGETTVKVVGSGMGGPNTEFILALAIELQGTARVYAMACDSDGIDGTQDNAGALMDTTTIKRASKLGLAPINYLDNNDSYRFFKELGDLVVTGPTLTNVNDFRAIYIEPNQL